MTTTILPFGSSDPFKVLDSNALMAAPDLRALNLFVRTRVKSISDAEDIVQDTLLLALRHIGQFRFESSVGTWLRSIALNVIRGRWRSGDASRTVLADAQTLERLQVEDKKCSPLVEMERKEVRDRVSHAIAELPLTYRTVIELRDFQGLSLEKAAETLSISKPAIKSRHFRARNLLSKSLSKPRTQDGRGPRRMTRLEFRNDVQSRSGRRVGAQEKC